MVSNRECKICSGNVDDPCDTPSLLSKLRFKNFNRLVIGHLNINV